MTNQSLPQASPVASVNNDLALTVDMAKGYAEAAHAENMRRADRLGWNDFVTYYERHGFQTLPASPQSVALYMTALTERANFDRATLCCGYCFHAPRKRALWIDLEAYCMSPTKSKSTGTVSGQFIPCFIEFFRPFPQWLWEQNGLFFRTRTECRTGHVCRR
jgi:hypothetical protein